MKTIYNQYNTEINENNGEIFITNKITGCHLRINNNRLYTSITYEGDELIPTNINGLPAIKIQPH